MAALIKRLFNLERGEIVRAVLMFLYAFLLLSAYLILKPVRNSLFLNKFGADQLVYMYMIIAVAATPAASVYGWIADRTNLPRLVGGTTVFIVISLAAFWYLIGAQYGWLVYVFYVWVSLFGVFTTSQFWLLANYVFDAREAKRVFPFIAAGAIVGGMTGSALTNLLAELTGTENLLWICVLFMLICFGLLLIVWRMRRGDETKEDKLRSRKGDLKGILPVIRKSRHLILLTIMIGLTVMVSTFVDFQFNKVVNNSFDDKDKLTAFFGAFFFSLSFLSLLLQLLFSSRILRRFGVGAAILFLPVGLLLGSAAIFIYPVLASAILVKLSDGSFRYSINKTGLELLYLPVPVAIKNRIKAFMDVVGDRFARGIGGALLYLVSTVLAWPIQWISFLSAGLISIWIAVAILIKREYSRTFRAALDTRTIDSEEIKVRLHEAASIDILSRTFRDGDRRQILFSLGLTAEEHDRRLAEPLCLLLRHEDSAIRQRALKQLAAIDNGTMAKQVEPLLKDPDGDVRLEAVRYFCHGRGNDAATIVETYLKDKDPVLRATACRCVFEDNLAPRVRAMITVEFLENLLTPSDETNRQIKYQLAEALRFARADDALGKLLSRFTTDEDPRIRRAAFVATARLSKREHLPTIIGCLATPATREPAEEALLSFGPAVLGTLRDSLINTEIPLPVRLRIPGVIAKIASEESADILLTQLNGKSSLLRYATIRALNRLKRTLGHLPIEKSKLSEQIQNEARDYYTATLYLQSLQSIENASASEGLLRQTLHDRQQLHLEQAFRLAGLIYSTDDMNLAYLGVISESSIVRARAVEFLDTVWERSEKQILFPILERQENLTKIARGLTGLTSLSREETIGKILRGTDSWLAACAAYLVGTDKLETFRADIQKLTEDPDPALKETARWALARLNVK